MTKTNFSVVSIKGLRVVTVVENNQIYTGTDESHENLDQIIEALGLGEDVGHLFDAGRAVQKTFDDIHEGRVAVRGGVVYFDEEPVRNKIVDTILQFIQDGSPITPLVKFMERLAANPIEHSRDMLFQWIDNNGLEIDDDGMIVAYKYVGEGYRSIASGKAFTDGIEYVGNIPNPIGAVVTMPRSEVEHDPSQHCHVGLHVGGSVYVEWYGSRSRDGHLLRVRFDPRDVVSVPNDHSFGKVRVCRYEVVAEASWSDISNRSGYYKNDEFDDEDVDDEYDDDYFADVEWDDEPTYGSF